MSVPNRKLGFYNLYINDYSEGTNNRGVFDMPFFIELLDYICSLDNFEKIENDEANKKIYALKSCSDTNAEIIKVVLQSGKYGHNPDYLSSADDTIRTTSKTPVDAEEELTHLCIKLKSNKAIFLLEERQSGVAAKRIVSYLNVYSRKYDEKKHTNYNYSFFIEDYPAGDIESFFNSMTETKTVELFAHKEDMGSEMKVFAGLDSPMVRDEVKVVFKAKPRESYPASIKNAIKQFFNSNDDSPRPNYTRIRICGKTDSKSPIIFDSEVLRRKKFVEANINENGIVNSEDLFMQMIPTIRDVE